MTLLLEDLVLQELPERLVVSTRLLKAMESLIDPMKRNPSKPNVSTLLTCLDVALQGTNLLDVLESSTFRQLHQAEAKLKSLFNDNDRDPKASADNLTRSRSS